jgi:hypothetical protein
MESLATHAAAAGMNLAQIGLPQVCVCAQRHACVLGTHPRPRPSLSSGWVPVGAMDATAL